MKQITKKLTLLITVFSVILTFTNPQIVEAEDCPSCSLLWINGSAYTNDSSHVVGSKIGLTFKLFCPYEKAHIWLSIGGFDIGDGDSSVSAYDKIHNLTNASSEDYLYYCEWDTTSLPPGRYEIIAQLYYYSNNEWISVPRTVTSIYLTEPKLAKANFSKDNFSKENKTVKYNKLKKKSITIKPFKFKKITGTLSFKKLAPKKNKKIKVNKKTGKITLKKGLKKGTYKVKICIKAITKHNFSTRNYIIKIKVK